MPKRGENIRKRKDGRWEGRYIKIQHNGKNITGSVFGKTYQEAKEKLALAKAAQRQSAEEYSSKKDRLSFADTAEEWYDVTKPTLKPSSIANYRNILDSHLIPEFGTRDISDITRAEITAFSGKLLTSGGRQGQGLSPKTVSGILSVMKTIFDYVRHVKCCQVIDLDGITVKQSQRQLRVFSRVEQEIVSNFLLNETTPIKLGILLCLYTGLRIGEICALKWGDISFSEKKLCVRKTMQRVQTLDENGPRTRVIITTPKSDCSVRDIPIPDVIFQIILDMCKADDCFLLTGQIKEFIEPRTLENHFNAAMKMLGIENATMHTCRHTFATRSIELGFDVKALSEILGHASVAITLNRYVHPSMETKQTNMNLLTGLLGAG